MTPSQAYVAGVERGDWQHDPAQQAALRELDRIHAAILAPVESGLLSRLFGKAEAAKSPTTNPAK